MRYRLTIYNNLSYTVDHVQISQSNFKFCFIKFLLTESLVEICFISWTIGVLLHNNTVHWTHFTSKPPSIVFIPVKINNATTLTMRSVWYGISLSMPEEPKRRILTHHGLKIQQLMVMYCIWFYVLVWLICMNSYNLICRFLYNLLTDS